MPKPTTDAIDREEFEAFVRRAGLTLTQAQRQDLLEGFRLIRAAAARVRGRGKRPREAEPATIFRTDS